MASMSDGVVAVVGNGPLSESDRRSIERFSTVYRFNDLKNYRTREKCTHHVIRCSTRCPRGLCGSETSAAVVAARTVLVGTREEIDAAKESMQVDEEIAIGDESSINAHPVFERCVVASSLARTSSTERSPLARQAPKIQRFPTTGTILLDALNNNSDVRHVHVFGMNWNMFDTVHSKDEAGLVASCCQKCVVHPTRSPEYLPASHLTMQDMVDGVSCAIWILACILLLQRFNR